MGGGGGHAEGVAMQTVPGSYEGEGRQPGDKFLGGKKMQQKCIELFSYYTC